MTRTTAARVLPAVLAVVAVGISYAPASDAAPTNKTYVASAVVTDGSGHSAVLGTTPAVVTYTLTNTTKGPQAFASADITMPNGIVAVGGPTVNPPVTGFAATLDPTNAQLILLRSSGNVGVFPGSSISIDITVTSTSGCGVAWKTQVKQSNDFSGVGNDFVGTGTAPGQHLAWTVQPEDTQYNVAMGSQDNPVNDPTVTPVDSCGAPIAGAGGIVVTDAQGQLATTGLAVVGGSAQLQDVTFSTFDFTDTLTASLTGFAPATSDTFYVAQKLVSCTDVTKSCTSGDVTDSGKTTTTSITAGAGPTDKIVVSVKGAASGTCNQPSTANELPYGSIATFDVENRSKTVTMTLAKKYVNQVSNNGTPFMDICLDGSSVPFFDKFHYSNPQPGDQLVTTGLLPNCSSTGGAVPCLVSRTKNAGNEVIVFNLAAGDPHSSVY
jgi:hypothetical protein